MSGGCVWVLEEHGDSRDLWVVTLSRLGLSVVTLRDPQELLSRLRDHEPQPDCLVLNAWTAAARAAEIAEAVPLAQTLVLCTSAEHVRDWLALEAAEVLLEPVAPDDLLASVKRLCPRIARAAPAHQEPTALVALAASRGGLWPLEMVLRGFDRGLRAAVAVVQHRTGRSPWLLERLLERHCELPVLAAEHRQPLAAGVVYVAPSDRHLLVGEDRSWRLLDGPPIQSLHSAADPLFESAAQVFGPRAIVAVLSGGGRDGSRGAGAVALAGGVVVVQDPATAVAREMPRNAIASGSASQVLHPAEIGPFLARAVAGWTESGALRPSAPGPLAKASRPPFRAAG